MSVSFPCKSIDNGTVSTGGFTFSFIPNVVVNTLSVIIHVCVVGVGVKMCRNTHVEIQVYYTYYTYATHTCNTCVGYTPVLHM